jgi:formate dehydrogenase iron-sulfur subunit
LIFDASLLRHRLARAHTSMRRMAVLMTTDLASATKARFACGTAGGLLIPAVLLIAAPLGSWPVGVGAGLTAAAMLALLLAGEIAERYLFFAAAPPSRMPGALA